MPECLASFQVECRDAAFHRQGIDVAVGNGRANVDAKVFVTLAQRAVHKNWLTFALGLTGPAPWGLPTCPCRVC